MHIVIVVVDKLVVQQDRFVLKNRFVQGNIFGQHYTDTFVHQETFVVEDNMAHKFVLDKTVVEEDMIVLQGNIDLWGTVGHSIGVYNIGVHSIAVYNIAVRKVVHKSDFQDEDLSNMEVVSSVCHPKERKYEKCYKLYILMLHDFQLNNSWLIWLYQISWMQLQEIYIAVASKFIASKVLNHKVYKS